MAEVKAAAAATTSIYPPLTGTIRWGIMGTGKIARDFANSMMILSNCYL
jgi:hypothetical protein